MLSPLAALALVAAPCEGLILDAEVRPGGRDVVGTLRCLGGTGALDLAVYPAILGEPRGLDDVSRPWVYPDGFDPGWIAVDGVRAETAWLTVPADKPIHFATRIPRRTAILGHHRGTTYALAGWHPMVGNAEHERIEDLPITYTIRVPGDRDAWIGGRRTPAGGSRMMRGVHRGRTVPMVLAEALTAESSAAGPILIPRRAKRLRRASQPVWELRSIDAARDDHQVTKLREALALGRATAARSGLPVAAPLTVVRAPLRERFIAPFDGGFAISDRAFLFLDYGLFMGFHQLAVWRAELAAYALRAAKRIETEWPPDQIADAVGATLRDMMESERFGEKESADQLLDRFAVIPEIDSLVFAPQIPLVDALYEAVDEEPAARSHPDDFFHNRPRGKILFEKLVDRIGVEPLREVALDYADGGRPWVSRVSAATADAPVAQWLRPFVGPYPAVDYVLEHVSEGPDGIEVRVGRAGAEITEPITVLVEDDDGKEHRTTRVGPGTVRVEAPGPASRVIIDPDRRLVETSDRPDKLARFNNRTPDRWRFLLNNITGLVAVTNQQLSASSSFSLRRIYDLSVLYGASVVASPSTVGAGVSASYRFGEQLTPLSLASSVGIALGIERLRVEQGTGQPGNQLSVSTSYGYDDRLNPYYSFEGKGFRLRAAGVIASLDDVRDDFTFATAGASAYWLQPLGFHNGIFFRLRGDAILGDAPTQNLLRLGGRSVGARGFEPTELRGDARIIGSVEWRHALAVAGRVDLGGLLMWTRLEGAAFADAVYMPNDRPDCGGDMFYDVGYGLRFIGDVLNVTPAAFTIDLGLPLNRCDDETDRVPFSIYVGFLQSFIPF